MLVADELILSIDRGVRVLVVRPDRDVRASRCKLVRDPVSPDGERMLAPLRLYGNPPVGCETVHAGIRKRAVQWIAPEPVRSRSVCAEFRVDEIVPDHIGAQACDLIFETFELRRSIGDGITLLVCENGYFQAGVLFHGSCTVGALLNVTP